MFSKIFTRNILILIIVGLATAIVLKAALYYGLDEASLSADVQNR
jgi:hypothetical protein